MGGLKGVGEAAVESLIKERDDNGAYVSIFDMIKRVNQRTVNKKHWKVWPTPGLSIVLPT